MTEITAEPTTESTEVHADAAARQYEVVARAIAYLRTHARAQPSLAELAAAVQLSEFHLQRVFQAWAGISPKRFLQYLTKAHAQQALRAQQDVLSAAWASGLSGPGRLHDLLVTCEAMTPGEIRQGGAGVALGYGLGTTPLGMALVGWTPRGLCHLTFVDGDAAPHGEALAALWPAAQRQRDDAAAQQWLARVFAPVGAQAPLPLLLRGTNFQLKVWEALLRIEPAQLLSYGQLAQRLGMPRAARAVGSAVAANTVGYLIPCHRVIRETGELGQYRWHPDRKAALLAWEAGRMAGPEQPQS